MSRLLDTQSRSARARRLCLHLALAAAGSTLSVEARARCAFPPMDLALSYPDANTPAIPPDALLWLVPFGGALGGNMEVELDGVPLPAVGAAVPERYQFRPAEPLSLGEHQIDVRLVSVEGNTEPAADKTLSFRVAELEERTGDVDALRSARFFSSEAPEIDQACAAQTLYLGGCNDIAPPAIDRLDFAPIGDPLFYLVNGTLIHSVGCETATLGVWEPDGPVTHQVTAVLPTGLGPVRELEAGPSASSASEAGCCLGRATTDGAAGWLLALSFVLTARRRKTARHGDR